MANHNIETEEITKGLRLTVIVEYSFENIIAVFLLHNGKEYRGALLECDQGFFPHGIPFTSKPMIEQQKATVKSSPRSALDIKPGTENKPPDLSAGKEEKMEQSASTARFSYNTNPFLTNPRPVADIPTVEMKPVGRHRKTVRDIRLRPRQTLCSKCKSAIHESHKSHSIQSKSHSQMAGATTKLIPPNKSPMKMGVDFVPNSTAALSSGDRKRKASHQSPMVLLEDIQLKCMKQTLQKSSKDSSVSRHARRSSGRDVTSSNNGNKMSDLGGNRRNAQAKMRNNRSSSCGSTNSSTNSIGQDWLQVIEDSESIRVSSCNKGGKKEKGASQTYCNTKPSPAIKITIGQGAILKIPPRLPEGEAQHKDYQISEPKAEAGESVDYETYHKKAKKAAKKSKDRDKCKPVFKRVESTISLQEDEAVPFKNPKKHKKKHRHKHEHDSPETTAMHSTPPAFPHTVAQIEPKESELVGLGVLEANGESTALFKQKPNVDAENFENTLPLVENANQTRPRLVYTWKQNQGLSRVATSSKDSSPSVSPRYLIKSSPNIIPIGNSPHRRKNASPARVVSASPNWRFAPSSNCMLKDYPLRSKSSSTFSSGHNSEPVPPPEYGLVQPSEESQSHSSGLDSHISDFSDESADDCDSAEFFPGQTSPMRGEEETGIMKPLMMKIQTQNVEGCILDEGREIRVGDIVWGKIQGFPWWPGRVSNITITQRDNDVIINRLANVAWFGSNTISHMHCSDLFPFLEDFKARYNKKKKGQYRLAIKQATVAAQMLATETQQEFSIEDYEF